MCGHQATLLRETPTLAQLQNEGREVAAYEDTENVATHMRSVAKGELRKDRCISVDAIPLINCTWHAPLLKMTEYADSAYLVSLKLSTRLLA